MTKEQQEAYRALLLNIVNIKSQEEQQYTQQFYRLLVLGNGTGVILLSSFIGAIAGKNVPYFLELISPLSWFFAGMILAALIYFPLMSVANQATTNIGDQVNKFFMNTLDIEDFQGYGFNKFGQLIITLMLMGSLIAFGVGVYKCIVILQNAAHSL